MHSYKFPWILGRNIRLVRRDRGLTQGQLADKAHISRIALGVEKLSKAHQELAKNGEISFSTLADIQKSMTGVIPDIDSYVKRVS